MKIAVIEKTNRTNSLQGILGFEYDLFSLTTSTATKIFKKDITLEIDYDEYDFIILVGKDAAKNVAKVSNLAKMSGQLIDNKFIPILSPMAAKFNPGLKDSIDQSIKRTRELINGTYTEDLGVYKGIEKEKDALAYLEEIERNARHVVVDIETSSLYCREGYILGIALTYKAGTGVYINTNCITEKVENKLKSIFKRYTCIFHNAKFDIKWLQYHFGFEFPKFHDTMLQHYVLNENEAHDLKSLVLKYTDMGEYDKELDSFKSEYIKARKMLQKDFSYEVIPFEVMYKYAAADADGTIRLFNKFNPVVQKHFNYVYTQILIEGTKFLIEMEENGVPFQVKRLHDANTELATQIIALKKDLYKYDCVKTFENNEGKEFNPGSPTQLRVLLFVILGLKPISKTATGAWSTDKFTLQALEHKHPIVKSILKIREVTKIRSTYISKIILGLDRDNRLRTGFHLHTVTSGRLSSSGKLNMQQLPRDNKLVKKCIVSDVKDWVVFNQDLATAEMYYAGSLSKDAELCNVFARGQDFHSSIAKIAFQLDITEDQIKKEFPEYRQASKAIAFGILYGAGADKVAEQAGITVAEAKNIIKTYFKKFSTLENWIKQTKDKISGNGFIYSALGRKRRVPDTFSASNESAAKAVRSAMNFTVQSVSSDINLLGAIDANKEIKRRGLRAEIFALVHDSILGHCHKDDVSKVKEVLRSCTQKDRGVGIPGTPIGIDFDYGESYGDLS